MSRLQQHHPGLVGVALWSIATLVIKGTLLPVCQRENLLDLDNSQSAV